MISADLRQQIAEALRRGTESQRQIARRLGVGRGTVSAIALGRATAKSKPRLSSRESFCPDTSRPSRRCAVCGARVYPPCHACATRRGHGHSSPGPDDPEPPLTIALRDEEAERYIAIHARKVLQDLERAAEALFVPEEEELCDGRPYAL